MTLFILGLTVGAVAGFWIAALAKVAARETPEPEWRDGNSGD